MEQLNLGTLPEGKKVYFASDFHLGTPTYTKSKEREQKIVKWLGSIEDTAHAIFFVGDIFDFWFEYKYVVPKGFLHFLSKLVQLKEKGVQLFFFTGNHDMWFFDYFPQELSIPIYREPIELLINKKKILIGHGDGLGPGDRFYKTIKFFFKSKLCQRLFAFLHPSIGMWIANSWSRKSRSSNASHDSIFLGEKEFLIQYCKTIEATSPYDYYLFGHRHYPTTTTISSSATYINLGDWITFNTYAEFSGDSLILKEYLYEAKRD